MSQQYAHFDGNEKRISKMTVLTLSVYHPLLRKQIPLATMDCESENKESAELFWKIWIEALQEFNSEIKFNPTGIILDEKSCNWNAMKKYFGDGFIKRCVSGEFHFKQSVTRRLKDSMLSKSRTSHQFRTLSKGLLEAQTESQFHESMSMLESFIQEDPARLPLENWLKWWVSRKTHIFRTFKRKCSPESNLAEVIHSSWVTQKRTQVSIYEACIYDICEQVTVKHMLKGYGEGSFIGGTGPSFGNLQKWQKAV